jgi:hypothetical protein
LATLSVISAETLNNTLNLEQVVAQAGLVPPGLTLPRVVKETPFGPVKIRIYASPREAQQQASLVELMASKPELDGALLPGLLGCWNECLVFSYPELDSSEAPSASLKVAFGIGQFLAALHLESGEGEAGSGMHRSDLDEEFAGWMQRFQRMRLLSAKLAHMGLSYYQAERPVELPVSLDYWDAMPHNFGIYQGKVLLLDEKHLRPSFSGVGLVKPLQLLPAEQSSQLLRGYQSLTNLEIFERYRQFLEFYYLAAALYFYSLSGAAGRISLGRNPRFLDYRQRFIQLTTRNSRMENVLAKVDLLLAFPKDTLYILKPRPARSHSITASS